jgi:hypothetical protein
MLVCWKIPIAVVESGILIVLSGAVVCRHAVSNVSHSVHITEVSLWMLRA